MHNRDVLDLYPLHALPTLRNLKLVNVTHHANLRYLTSLTKLSLRLDTPGSSDLGQLTGLRALYAESSAVHNEDGYAADALLSLTQMTRLGLGAHPYPYSSFASVLGTLHKLPWIQALKTSEVVFSPEHVPGFAQLSALHVDSYNEWHGSAAFVPGMHELLRTLPSLTRLQRLGLLCDCWDETDNDGELVAEAPPLASASLTSLFLDCRWGHHPSLRGLVGLELLQLGLGEHDLLLGQELLPLQPIRIECCQREGGRLRVEPDCVSQHSLVSKLTFFKGSTL